MPAARPAAVPAADATPASGPRVPWGERLLLFGLAYVAYAGLGLYVILHLKLVEEDGEARLAHAFFALWNQPPKLAAVGTYWPPLDTVVLLPFAAVKPLATSLAALPLSSALFAAMLVVVLDGALARGGLERGWRWLLVAAFALNPVVVFYAVNGMAESLYLLLLAWSVALFTRWLQEGGWASLAGCGVALALAVLARYEIAFWIAPMLAAMVVALALRRAPRARYEATMIVLLAPLAYALGVWVFLNWTVFGDSFGFLSGSLGNVTGSPVEVSHLAGHAVPSAARGVTEASRGGLDAGKVVHQTLSTLRLQAMLFAPTFLVAGALLVMAVRRRRVEALFLVGALLVGTATTIALAVVGTPDTALHLRYNIRAIPIVVIAAGVALGALAPRPRRRAALALLVAMAASIPVTGFEMWHYASAKGEHAFLAGLFSGHSQDGVDQPRGTGIRLADQRDMARFVARRVKGRDAVLTDDAQTFGVMLLDGHPGRYLDRIDIGDKHWTAIRDHPRRSRVGWFLVQRRQGGVAIDQDLILDAYPQLSVEGGGLPFARLAHANGSYALYRLVG